MDDALNMYKCIIPISKRTPNEGLDDSKKTATCEQSFEHETPTNKANPSVRSADFDGTSR
jgi:hypothetical protein